MDLLVLSIFALVYVGMILGEIPGLALDRSGIALLGAIAILASGRLTLEEAARSVDAHTIALLFGLMVISAQFRLGGFYTETVRRIAAHSVGTDTLLLSVIIAAGLLSALLANDIVCLAMAPMLIEVCARRRITPVPFLLALACASNVGSAATLIGNPQNMFIGESLQLPFAGNLLIVGSIANIIVVEQARAQGVAIDWRLHARTGVPVAVATLLVAAVWLWVRAG